MIRLVSAATAAETLGVSVCTLRRQWRRWGLRGLYVGRQLRFREDDIEAWLERNWA